MAGSLDRWQADADATWTPCTVCALPAGYHLPLPTGGRPAGAAVLHRQRREWLRLLTTGQQGEQTG